MAVPGPAGAPFAGPRLLPDDVFRRLCRARETIHERHDEPLALADLARAAGMSRFHFLRRFRDAFGRTPHELLTDVRIERAKRLLGGPGASVTDVCLDVGFSSLGSFSTLFAQRVGCPPSAFRRVWQVADAITVAASYVPWCFAGRFAGAHFRNIREASLARPRHHGWQGGSP
jgi:AraC-like DNA-binding protein